MSMYRETPLVRMVLKGHQIQPGVIGDSSKFIRMRRRLGNRCDKCAKEKTMTIRSRMRSIRVLHLITHGTLLSSAEARY